MNPKIITIVLSLGLTLAQYSFAQTVINEKIQTAGDSLILSFDIQGKVGPYRRITVTPKVSGIEKPTDALTHLKPFTEKILEERKTLSKGKQIIWPIFKDLDAFPGKDQLKIEYDLQNDTISSPIYWVLSYSASTNAPYGIALQHLSRYGFYFRGNFFNPTTKTVDPLISNEGFIATDSVYTFNANSRIKSYTLSAGFTKRFGVHNHFYLGAGYGLKQLLWKVEYLGRLDLPREKIAKTEWRINDSRNFQGILAEAGVYWKIKDFVLDTGVGTIQGKEFFANLGIGYVFASKSYKDKKEKVRPERTPTEPKLRLSW